MGEAVPHPQRRSAGSSPEIGIQQGLHVANEEH